MSALCSTGENPIKIIRKILEDRSETILLILACGVQSPHLKNNMGKPKKIHQKTEKMVSCID